MIPTSFYFALACCRFNPADETDNRPAKYSSYFCSIEVEKEHIVVLTKFFLLEFRNACAI